MLIDTHAHLDGSEFTADLDDVIRRAHEAGVHGIVSAGQDRATSRATLRLAERCQTVAPAIGVHPHCAHSDNGSWLDSALDNAALVAIGEMGLDYHYDFSPRDAQQEVFVRQLKLASQHNLPAIIHCREAYDDLQRLLSEHYTKKAAAVVHCFTEGFETGMRLIANFGLYLGIGGAVTFKNAKELQDAVARLPLEHLVLETDCPYMTPMPHRGKRNEPSYVKFTCQAIAALRNTTPDEIERVTTDNALRLFPRLSARLLIKKR